MTLYPIPYQTRPRPPVEIGENCPACDVPTERGTIPCPDGRAGCAVLHHGWICPKCRVAYTTTKRVSAEPPPAAWCTCGHKQHQGYCGLITFLGDINMGVCRCVQGIRPPVDTGALDKELEDL